WTLTGVSSRSGLGVMKHWILTRWFEQQNRFWRTVKNESANLSSKKPNAKLPKKPKSKTRCHWRPTTNRPARSRLFVVAGKRPHYPEAVKDLAVPATPGSFFERHPDRATRVDELFDVSECFIGSAGGIQHGVGGALDRVVSLIVHGVSAGDNAHGHGQGCMGYGL